MELEREGRSVAICYLQATLPKTISAMNVEIIKYFANNA